MQDLILSDSFLTPREGYEWTAHMININAGHNPDILEKCPPLKGYAALVSYVREYQEQNLSLSEAVDQATQRCIQEGYLKAYLLKKRSEVKLMLLTEFNEEAFVQTIKEEGREEGRREGREQGREQGRYLSLQSLVEKAVMPLAEAMDILGFSSSERAGYETWVKTNKNI
ncbi:MAG: hypothetical protein HFG64_04655 [Lachnospiraceae bacterium]|nr:hypothetical protein [Lachnospiraceae bacterium]